MQNLIDIFKRVKDEYGLTNIELKLDQYDYSCLHYSFFQILIYYRYLRLGVEFGPMTIHLASDAKNEPTIYHELRHAIVRQKKSAIINALLVSSRVAFKFINYHRNLVLIIALIFIISGNILGLEMLYMLPRSFFFIMFILSSIIWIEELDANIFALRKTGKFIPVIKYQFSYTWDLIYYILLWKII
jgi:hypothetical protein